MCLYNLTFEREDKVCIMIWIQLRSHAPGGWRGYCGSHRMNKGNIVISLPSSPIPQSNRPR